MKQNKQEIWRDVPGYEGYYQVSNLGRIRSLDRTVLTKNGREYFYNGKIIEGTYNDGYRQVGLSRDGKQRGFKVSQVVAMTFLNHIPNGNTLVVDHIDGDRTNDNVDNLRIVTNRDNLSTCYRANESSLSSDFVGVSYHKKTDRWQAQIQLKGKKIYLGLFNNEEDASNTYQKVLGEINDGTFKIEDYRASFTSTFKGICYHKANQKYIAQPTINGKQVYLGSFENEESAHQAILEYETIQPIVKVS